MSFLDPSYVKPTTSGKYLKLQSGDNKIRILSEAITGWCDWQDKQPIRTKERPERSIDTTKPAKHFWAFVVWSYLDKEIKILELTQSTIQDNIFSLHSDENWGDPRKYDLCIKKTGEKMETKYTVIPTPPMAVHPEIKNLYESTTIDLTALYRGADPFATSAPENSTTGIVEPNTAYTDNYNFDFGQKEEINVQDIPF